ncbi:hypothetical protein H4S02_004482 [Coemansia sp. RSA 2611]|nr:hypothetical protein H4S02_004482 [Coemansia sp. RSA 2611]
MASELTPETLEILRKDPLKSALTATTLQNFQMAKQFPDNKQALTSIDFDPTGQHCITTSLDESLRIYDCMSGTRAQVSYSKKYGCNLARFAGQPGCVAYASTKLNDTVRYLSYETNQFIRYFVGHTGMVTSLQRAPDAQSLVSAGMDGTVRMWSVDEVKPTGTVSVGGDGVVAAIDPSGVVVAAAVAGAREIRLYDVRKLTRGAFASAVLDTRATCAGLEFARPTGAHMVLAMSDGTVLVVDAFALGVRAVLVDTAPGTDRSAADLSAPVLQQMQGRRFGQGVTTTPDGRTVIAGCENGSVAYWDIEAAVARSGAGPRGAAPAVCAPTGVWSGSHDGPVGVCAFNPELMECASGAQALTLWTSI